MSAPPAKKPRSGREKTGKEKTSRKIAKEKGGIESDLEHFLQKGDAHRKAGQYKDAIQVLDRALMLKPCARAFAARGSAKRALLLREQALADYSAAVKTEPMATYYSSRGVVKSELGWYRDALEDFQRSLKLDPEDKVANWGKEWIKRQEAEAPLRIITLGGFKFMAAMNTRYTERRSPEHAINGRETYWSHDNNHLLYWSSKERRWKGCRAVDVGRISGQSGPACIGAPENVHVLSPSLRRGWFEWNGKEWVKLEGAGLLSFGPVTAPLRALQLVGFWPLDSAEGTRISELDSRLSPENRALG
ncbi:unnamed protein product [Effrenium voratum]|uniref:Tetratricopeptide repeat protein n=1 Tax=Effrenium voratum TaxID=2562239 RepID=A0AA36JPP2_9DINO|nr:unnamed protein product [Effrenium voratum]